MSATGPNLRPRRGSASGASSSSTASPTMATTLDDDDDGDDDNKFSASELRDTRRATDRRARARARDRADALEKAEADTFALEMKAIAVRKQAAQLALAKLTSSPTSSSPVSARVFSSSLSPSASATVTTPVSATPVSALASMGGSGGITPITAALDSFVGMPLGGGVGRLGPRALLSLLAASCDSAASPSLTAQMSHIYLVESAMQAASYEATQARQIAANAAYVTHVANLNAAGAVGAAAAHNAPRPYLAPPASSP